MHKKITQSGLSLVELTVVILLMGILVVSVLYGLSVTENAKIKSYMVQVNLYKSAATSFRKQYGTWPGDFAQAQERLNGCTTAQQCVNGNGDQIVASRNDSTSCQMPAYSTANQPYPCRPANITSDVTSNGSELSQFWRHLAYAGLIDGLRLRPNRYNWGESMPRAKLAGGVQILFNRNSDYLSQTRGHFFVLERDPMLLHASMGGSDASISPSIAWRLDVEMDDGHPNTGNFRSIGQSGCGIFNSPAGYDGSTGFNKRQCTSFYRLDP